MPIEKTGDDLPDFKTASSIERASYDTQNSVVESLETILQSKRIRLILLRHYPQKAWKDRWDDIIDSFQVLPSHLQEMLRGVFLDPSKTLILTNTLNGPDRVLKSVQDIKDVFWIQENHIKNFQLKWTYNSWDDRISKRKESITEFSELGSVLMELEKQRELVDIDTIVIIANRKYAVHFNTFITGPKTISESTFEKTLEQNGYLLCDLPHDLKPIRNPKTPPLILPDDYRFFQDYLGKSHLKISCLALEHELCGLLEQKWELERLFSTKNTPINVLVYCLQKLLWRHSEAEIKQILLFHYSDNQVPDCLLDLLCSHPSWRIVYKMLWLEVNYPSIQQSLARHNRPEILKETGFINSHLLLSRHRALSIFSTSLDSSIQTINQNNDPVTSNILIKRSFYNRRTRPPEEIQLLEEKAKKDCHWEDSLIRVSKFEDLPFSFEDTILSDDSTFVALMGNVGEWKSTELARMFYSLQNDKTFKDTKSLFYNVRDLHAICKDDYAPNMQPMLDMIADRLTSDIRILKEVIPNETVVVFFDWIDELPEAIQKLVITTFTKLSKKYSHLKIILGTRPFVSGIVWNNAIKKVYFEPIGKDAREWFIKSRIQDYLKKLYGDNDAMSSQLILSRTEECYISIQKALDTGIVSEELKSTPLILFFLTQLAVDWKLETIRNRSDLYEKIIEKILFEHQGEKDLPKQKRIWIGSFESIGADTDVRDKKMLFDILGRCAYVLFKNPNISITRKFIEDILLEYQVKESRLRSICGQIFLLYRAEGIEGGENEESYSFILKSFQEYFLAEYLASMWEDWNREIYAFRDEAMFNDENKRNWGDWRNFRPVVMFYVQILGNRIETALMWNNNNAEYRNRISQQLIRLISSNWLIKNDDIFWTNLSMWLDVLVFLYDSTLLIESFWTPIRACLDYINTVIQKSPSGQLKINSIIQITSKDKKHDNRAASFIQAIMNNAIWDTDEQAFFQHLHLTSSHLNITLVDALLQKLENFKDVERWWEFWQICWILVSQQISKNFMEVIIKNGEYLISNRLWQEFRDLILGFINETDATEVVDLIKKWFSQMLSHMEWHEYTLLSTGLSKYLPIEVSKDIIKNWLSKMQFYKEWHEYSWLCHETMSYFLPGEFVWIVRPVLSWLTNVKGHMEYGSIWEKMLGTIPSNDIFALGKEELLRLAHSDDLPSRDERKDYFMLLWKINYHFGLTWLMEKTNQGYFQLNELQGWSEYRWLCEELSNSSTTYTKKSLKLIKKYLWVLIKEEEWWRFIWLLEKSENILERRVFIDFSRKFLRKLRKSKDWTKYLYFCEKLIENSASTVWQIVLDDISMVWAIEDKISSRMALYLSNTPVFFSEPTTSLPAIQRRFKYLIRNLM